MRFLVALLAAWLLLGTPFSGGNVADLSPVEILCLSREGGEILAVCDSGIAARGWDVAAAVENLHAAAPGRLFLGTVDNVVFTDVTPDAALLLDVGLRPAVGLYRARKKVEDPDALAEYLRTHGGGTTLGMLAADASETIPMLQTGETGLVLP